MSPKDRLKNHKLEVICDTPKVKCFRLYEEINSNCQSTYFTFLPCGICISGDVTPGENANFCNFKTLGWFLGDLSPSYLEEKFRLPQFYDSEATKQCHKDNSEEELDIDWEDESEVIEHLEGEDLIYSCDEHELDWLVALQEAFRREYNVLHPII